ncbi:DTW domain-containing protein [Rheinheimera riviphila]|nr:tRNA-uridine aminocarboxypropyltransferase [Rheinheimera riviphila]
MQSAAQPVAAAIELILLTHATEFNKSTNTGALVAPALAQHPEITVKRLAWSRVAPDPQLLTVTPSNPLWLLYPTPEAQVLEANNVIAAASQKPCSDNPCTESPSAVSRRFILLDATWQLAHKMYRQSPYLQALPTLSLQSSQPSQYLLRRNQRQQGWCTAESVALLLAATGYASAAQKVSEAFFQFNQRN